MTRSNPQQMARWLARRERHSWSWAELSERSGHPVWKLRYWQQRAVASSASKSDRSGGFVTVDIVGPVTTRSTELCALEITTPSGYRVTVTHDFDPEHLRRVVQALERGC